ncbi:hypothetical protein J6590_071986 [Homalodisca vitripennis]|nr:hypothetical protein J6590_071986 [Homalodisca vitripennis]
MSLRTSIILKCVNCQRLAGGNEDNKEDMELGRQMDVSMGALAPGQLAVPAEPVLSVSCRVGCTISARNCLSVLHRSPTPAPRRCQVYTARTALRTSIEMRILYIPVGSRNAPARQGPRRGTGSQLLFRSALFRCVPLINVLRYNSGEGGGVLKSRYCSQAFPVWTIVNYSGKTVPTSKLFRMIAPRAICPREYWSP